MTSPNTNDCAVTIYRDRVVATNPESEDHAALIQSLLRNCRDAMTRVFEDAAATKKDLPAWADDADHTEIDFFAVLESALEDWNDRLEDGDGPRRL